MPRPLMLCYAVFVVAVLAGLPAAVAEEKHVEPALTLRGHRERVYSVEFSRDGQSLVTVSGDETVAVWDAATGKQTASFDQFDDQVLHASFSPDAAQWDVKTLLQK